MKLSPLVKTFLKFLHKPSFNFINKINIFYSSYHLQQNKVKSLFLKFLIRLLLTKYFIYRKIKKTILFI